jgi:hypothetical protein
MRRSRALTTLALLSLLGVGTTAGLALGLPAGGFDFADWTAVSANTATGTLGTRSISLSGSHVSNAPSSRVDGSSTVFASSDFTPPLPTSDAIEFQGAAGYSYTLDLGAPTPNPVIHLASLASTLDFGSGVSVQRISGEPGFTASGHQVSGQLALADGDSDGTVRLAGTYEHLTFTTSPDYADSNPDGIYVQVGADLTPPDTAITSGPPDGTIVGSTPPTFQFASDDSGATFECRAYDPANPDASDPRRHFEPCTSPYQPTDQGVARGEQTYFEVRAVDTSGNADPSPATRAYVRKAPADLPAKSTCDPVPLHQVIGRKVEDNCRISQIKHGKVPCLEVDTGRTAKCRFHSDRERWLRSKTGRRFAVVGDPIAKGKGHRGSYVIAERAGTKKQSPCAETGSQGHAKDSAGALHGSELGGTCNIELLGAYPNASHLPMDNVATRTVCSTTQPAFGSDTNNSATAQPSPEPGVVFCWTGDGAGLNDPNGTERDAQGVYIPGQAHCHLVISNGYESYASKRPAVVGYPAHVDIHSPILWRPVASNVRVAN